ncbi:MAG TPA: hypothetical protein ACFCUD_02755 [Cyclobacteriaceae bacterium]
MKFNFVLIASLWFLSIHIDGFSQDFKKLKKLEAKAEAAFYGENFIEAAELYEELLTLQPGNNYARYHHEITQLLTSKEGKSPKEILKYAANEGAEDKFFNYWMGRIYYKQNMFSKALNSFKAFLDVDAYKSDEIIAESKMLVERCNYILGNIPSDFMVVHLGNEINSSSDEISPVYFSNTGELLFISSRKNDLDNATVQYQIYQTNYAGNKWKIPVIPNLFRNAINGINNLKISNYENNLLIADNNHMLNSKREKDQWLNPEKLDSKISRSDFSSDFFISQDGSIIIFSSDKSVEGGLELYQSKKDEQTGAWSKPTFMGFTLNSPQDEGYPYLSPDKKTLYFSSMGHNSMGGFDVYKSEWIDQANDWSQPVNLGKPLNTTDDEMYFKMSSNERFGYFSSDRRGSNGNMDIYFFWKNNYVPVIGFIVEKSNKQHLKNVNIEFTPSNILFNTTSATTDEYGEFKTKLITNEKYMVEIRQNDQTIYKDVLTVPENKKYTIYKDFYVEDTESENVQFELAGNKSSDGIAKK